MTDDYADDIQNSPKLRLFALVRSDFGWKTRSFLATKKTLNSKMVALPQSKLSKIKLLESRKQTLFEGLGNKHNVFEKLII